MTVWTERVTGTGNSVVITNARAQDVRLLWVHLEYTSSATAGNRQIRMALKNSSGTTHSDIHAGVVQAASNTYHYSLMPGTYRETAVVDNSIQVPFPIYYILQPGWSITVYDLNNVSGADTYVLAWQWGE